MGGIYYSLSLGDLVQKYASLLTLMKAWLLVLLVMAADAVPSRRRREAQPASKSLRRLVKDAMRLAVDQANHIYTECIGDAFMGMDSRHNQSAHDIFAPFPCNCLCHVCWRTPRDDLMALCEDHCEDSCKWNFKRHSGRTDVRRAATEVCFGLIDRISLDLGGFAKLFRGFWFR